jgi:hypothetical protein
LTGIYKTKSAYFNICEIGVIYLPHYHAVQGVNIYVRGDLPASAGAGAIGTAATLIGERGRARRCGDGEREMQILLASSPQFP